MSSDPGRSGWSGDMRNGIEVRSFAVRKQAIDMRRIHTVGRDIMDSTFTGDTRSAYGILLRFHGLVCLRWV